LVFQRLAKIIENRIIRQMIGRRIETIIWEVSKARETILSR